MTAVFLGLGSNIERERYITTGLDALVRLLGELTLSSVYDAQAIGFAGQPFLNMVAGATTDLTLNELAVALRHIEIEHGRPVNATRFSARQLDIDILTYGEALGEFEGITLPREEILQNAFVLCPLAELAPDKLHPGVQRSYGELWEEYPQQTQTLQRVAFSWRGRSISLAV